MMQKLLIGIWLVLFLPVSAMAQPEEKTIRNVMHNVVDGFVRPGYAAFEKSVTSLGRVVDDMCASPDAQSLDAARTAFSSVAKSWAGVELVRFGPVAEENRFERILFYPDRKGTGLKQVQRILATQDETASDISKITGKSVAVQGLGALEFVLFGSGSDKLANGDGFRCRYALAISENLKVISAGLSSGWSKTSDATAIWTDPGIDNPVLKSPAEAVNELLGTLVHGLENIKDVRIGAFLSGEGSRDRPKVALFRRSENTLMMIVENIRSVKTLLVQSEAKTLLDDSTKAIFTNVIFELDNAERVAASITRPVANALGDEEMRGRLEYVRTSLGYAIDILDQDFAQATGFSSGFSFSDGD
ncbi:MAG: peptidase M75, Imelysin [Rhizobiaceae bacterium]|nr:peptidase M75, Imelysin [Rhizobiaceae bacterium]